MSSTVLRTTHVNLFNLHNNPIYSIIIIFFCRWGKKAKRGETSCPGYTPNKSQVVCKNELKVKSFKGWGVRPK